MTGGTQASEKAVIVIDLQTAMFEEEPIFAGDVIVKRVRSVLAWARTQGHRVCFIRHDGGTGDPLAPGAPGWTIWPALGQMEEEPTFSKSVGDAFSQPALVDWAAGVNEVVLLGAQSDYCVAATTRGALERGFAVTVVGDAHSTVDGSGLSAAEIIARENAAFEKAGARIVTTAELTRRPEKNNDINQ